MSETGYDIADLVELMRRLRDPETGCPWDLKQDYLSITPSTIEEVYEVVDAIERNDFEHLKEELGDLLFQIIFYAQLAKEEGRFDFYDIASTLTAKLVRRHPHVFPDGTLASVRENQSSEQSEQVVQRWEQIKAEERKDKGNLRLLDDVPQALPSLQRAQKLQKRVAKAGMDWRSVDAALENLEGEIHELRQAIAQQSAIDIEDELGDVIFSAVNVARKLKCDADKSLRLANRKFEMRIRQMERLFKQDSKAWSELDDAQLEHYWQKSKELASLD